MKITLCELRKFIREMFDEVDAPPRIWDRLWRARMESDQAKADFLAARKDHAVVGWEEVKALGKRYRDAEMAVAALEREAKIPSGIKILGRGSIDPQ